MVVVLALVTFYKVLPAFLVYVADSIFRVNGRKEYVGLAVHIRLEVWNRVLCSVKWHSG
jgi:hypothetical protein